MGIKLINPLGRNPTTALDRPSQDVILLNILLELRLINEYLSGRADPNALPDEMRANLMTEVL